MAGTEKTILDLAANLVKHFEDGLAAARALYSQLVVSDEQTKAAVVKPADTPVGATVETPTDDTTPVDDSSTEAPAEAPAEDPSTVTEPVTETPAPENAVPTDDSAVAPAAAPEVQAAPVSEA